MPRLALALCVLWVVSLFVVRTVIQWRQTGSTGIHGFHGRVGSLPWLAGVSASLGIVVSPLAPLATLRAWPGGALLLHDPTVHLLGAALTVLSILGALGAQISMGDSWRIGVDESERTTLVTDGAFAWVRNPIFSGVMLSAAGLVLVVPNWLSLLALVSTVVGIQLQVRAVEEPHLLRVHPDDYRKYASRVGRFVPGVGLLDPAKTEDRALPTSS